MKNWKIPSIILAILILAFSFQWGDLGSTTNNGTTIKTKIDHWNGSVCQTTIKNGSYSEKVISPGWIEASRKPIDKEVKYQEVIVNKNGNPPSPKTGNIFDNVDDYWDKVVAESSINQHNDLQSDKYLKSDDEVFGSYTASYVTKTKTIQEAPVPIYWLSSNGLTKIWTYVTSVIGIWLIVAFAMTQRKKQQTMKK